MRWNPFRRAALPDASDSSFESTVVDDAAAIRLGGTYGADASAAALRTGSGTRLPNGLIVESDSIGHVGRYALKTVLGQGGLGTVYAAWDPLLSRTVALKTLHIDADPSARGALDALFLNEARAAAGLSHPHIVTVFDAGPSDTGVYIAMERLQGQDLRHLLQQGVRPGPVEAAQVVRRVADALAYAHRKGVVHCDVKPANIFMTGRMHPKVLDFGIARVAHRDVPALEGLTAGSPYYLAPEQVDGRSVDRRSDVYSLGVVLYELLVGRRPFEGKSIEEITAAVKAGDALPAHRASPKVPLGLSTIAARAMARDPAQRFPSARHLAMELRHWTDSAEARAVRDARGSTPRSNRTSSAMQVARVAAPLLALGLIGALWWVIKSSQPGADAAAQAVPAPARPGSPAPAATPRLLSTPESTPALRLTDGDASPAEASPPTTAALAGTTLIPVQPVVATTASTSTSTTAAATAAMTATPRTDTARRRRLPTTATTATDGAAAAKGSEGVVQLAVSPWGQVEVDGRTMGISPPLSRLSLSSGSHTVTVRNADFPAYSATLNVSSDNPVTLRHRFGP